jgi:hypothetical protein
MSRRDLASSMSTVKPSVSRIAPALPTPGEAIPGFIVAMIDHIDYPNFKDSVEDRSLHAAYVGVWCAMAGLQHPPPEIERATHARSVLTSKNTP